MYGMEPSITISTSSPNTRTHTYTYIPTCLDSHTRTHTHNCLSRLTHTARRTSQCPVGSCLWSQVSLSVLDHSNHYKKASTLTTCLRIGGFLRYLGDVKEHKRSTRTTTTSTVMRSPGFQLAER